MLFYSSEWMNVYVYVVHIYTERQIAHVSISLVYVPANVSRSMNVGEDVWFVRVQDPKFSHVFCLCTAPSAFSCQCLSLPVFLTNICACLSLSGSSLRYGFSEFVYMTVRIQAYPLTLCLEDPWIWTTHSCTVFLDSLVQDCLLGRLSEVPLGLKAWPPDFLALGFLAWPPLYSWLCCPCPESGRGRAIWSFFPGS